MAIATSSRYIRECEAYLSPVEKYLLTIRKNSQDAEKHGRSVACRVILILKKD